MQTFTLRSDGIEAKIIPFGARLKALQVETPKGPVNVVQGYERADDYLTDKTSMGAICGRYANRIGGAGFTLEGKRYELNANQGGNCLHGGALGFGVRLWDVVAQTETAVTLRLVSADGEMGFPGRCVASAHYEARPRGLTITLEARVDQPCPINLVAHPYFNLHGEGRCDGHELQIFADTHTLTDQALVPTGEIISVNAHTDFRAARPLQFDNQPLYDLNYCLQAQEGLMMLAASLYSPQTGVKMDLLTDQVGLQFYDGFYLPKPFTGLCLEAQRFPDSPNKPHFPPALLRPGEVSVQRLKLEFSNQVLNETP